MTTHAHLIYWYRKILKYIWVLHPMCYLFETVNITNDNFSQCKFFDIIKEKFLCLMFKNLCSRFQLEMSKVTMEFAMVLFSPSQKSYTLAKVKIMWWYSPFVSWRNDQTLNPKSLRRWNELYHLTYMTAIDTILKLNVHLISCTGYQLKQSSHN